MKFLSKFIFILIIFLIVDYVSTNLFINKLNLFNHFYPQLKHRISDENYHHSFDKNINTYDTWGLFKYKFITNSLGFKDSKNREITKKSFKNKRIIINGDSFTEGIGYKYEDTFVGKLDEKLSQSNIEIFNAAVASQSPILYYKKIKHLIESEKIKFDSLIVFLDISDIPDEFYYSSMSNTSSKEGINKLHDIVANYLLKNFSSILFFNIIIEKLDEKKRYLEKKYYASKEFSMNFFLVQKKDVALFKAIKVKRGNWTHDDFFWKKHGREGRKLAEFYLDQLSNLCKKNNVDLSLIIYPWPSQIYYNLESIKHRLFWKNWSIKNNIKFYDLFEYFDEQDKIKTINKYFIEGDIHWNKKGHEYIYNILMKTYFSDF